MKKLLVVLLLPGLISAHIMTASAADVNYYLGKVAAFGSGANKIDFVATGTYIRAKVDLGLAYVGISALYYPGDEGNDKTKAKIGPQSQDLRAGLILGNDAFQGWEASRVKGSVKGGTPVDSDRDSSVIYGVFGGFNMTSKLNVNATLITAPPNKGYAKHAAKSTGTEFDITAKYQIYDKLSYTVGAGYLWTGDYFKGTNSAGVAGNDYTLMNRLSLSF